MVEGSEHEDPALGNLERGAPPKSMAIAPEARGFLRPEHPLEP
jgi:hypothetical protein